MSPSCDNVMCRKTPGRGFTRTFRKIWISNRGRVWMWMEKGWFPLIPNKRPCRIGQGPDQPKTWRQHWEQHSHFGCQLGGRISISTRPCLNSSVTTTPQLGRASLYGNKNPRAVTLALRQSENVEKQNDKADPFLLPSSVNPMFSKPILNPLEGIKEVFNSHPPFNILNAEYKDYSNGAEHDQQWRNPARSLFDSETELEENPPLSEVCSSVVSNFEAVNCDRDISDDPELENAMFQGFVDGLQEAKESGFQWSDVRMKTNLIINMTLDKIPDKEDVITKCIHKAQVRVFPQDPTPTASLPPTLNKPFTSPKLSKETGFSLSSV